LREAVRARDDLISVAAHELRNPKTPILSHVEASRLAIARAVVSVHLRHWRRCGVLPASCACACTKRRGALVERLA
jgi:hypothetical protein